MSFDTSMTDILHVDFFGQDSLHLTPVALNELQADEELLIIQPAAGGTGLTITVATVVTRGDECYYALRFVNGACGIYKLTEKGQLQLLHSITEEQPRTLTNAQFYAIDTSCINS